MAQEKKQGKFAQRAKATLASKTTMGAPESLSDLLDSEVSANESASQQAGNTARRLADKTNDRQDGKAFHRQDGLPVEQKVRRVRVEARVPEDLAETLREYTHQHRVSNAAVVAEALKVYFEKQKFPLVEPN